MKKTYKYILIAVSIILIAIIFWTQIFPQFYCTFLITHTYRADTYACIDKNYKSVWYNGYGNKEFVIVKRKIGILCINVDFLVASNWNYMIGLSEVESGKLKRPFSSRKNNDKILSGGKLERMTISKMIYEIKYNIISEYKHYRSL